eukprot:RCo018316
MVVPVQCWRLSPKRSLARSFVGMSSISTSSPSDSSSNPFFSSSIASAYDRSFSDPRTALTHRLRCLTLRGALQSLYPLEPLTLLQIGSGAGHFSAYLSSLGFRSLLGVEPAPDMLALATARGIPRATFVPGDALELPSEASTTLFDVVALVRVLEYA